MGKSRAGKRSAAAEALFARLSCGLGRRDEVPNRELGQDVARRQDAGAVATLVELLDDPAASSPAIKALYECGYIAPALLVPHAGVFFNLLTHRKNRLVWGAMIALWCVAKADAAAAWPRRAEIMQAFDAGSVITQDAAVKALSVVALSSSGKKRVLSPWLVDALAAGRARDLPGWLPDVLPALTQKDRDRAEELVNERLDQLKPSAQKKVRRLLEQR